MPGFTRWLDTPSGRAPVVSTDLEFADLLGRWKARWGIGRLSYLVPPGLYAIGNPTGDDPVLVTANYKMSYDTVRQELGGRSLWLLVLETYGINVWCAAGKGTFGTGELVRRVEAVRLGEVVRHRLLVLPVLGAAGISAHEVKRRTGFTVRYATIRAADLPGYLDAGMAAAPEMRELSFTPMERLALAPVEIVGACRHSLFIIALIVAVAGFSGDGSFSAAASLPAIVAYLGAVLAGTVVTPLFLPGLPTPSFSVKGAFVGVSWACILYGISGQSWTQFTAAAAFLVLPAVAGFYGLNFTGSTPFTSPSGVRKEMRLALPVMAAATIIGTALWVVGLWTA